MKKMYLRMGLIEATAGLILLAGAAVALLAPEAAEREIGERGASFAKLLMAAWPLAFLSLNLRPWPAARRLVLIVVALIFPILGILVYDLRPAMFPLGCAFAGLLILAGFIEPPKDATEAREAGYLFVLGASGGIAIYGLAGLLLHSIAPEKVLEWQLPGFWTGIFMIVAGLLAFLAEMRKFPVSIRIIAFAVAAGAFIVEGFYRFERLLYFSAAAFGVCGAVMLYHCLREALGHRPAAETALDETPFLGRLNEIAFWLAMSGAGLYAAFTPETDRVFFLFSALLALAGVAVVKSAWIEGHQNSVRVVIGVLVLEAAFICVIHATGGLYSPLAALAFAAAFAAAQASLTRFIKLGAVMFIGYFSIEAVRAFIQSNPDAGEIGARALLLSAAMGFHTVFTLATSRLRDTTLDKLQAANAQIEGSLAKSIEAQSRYARQSEEFRQLNAEAVEMRSALMNVLEDVEESKKLTERDNRRDDAIFFSIAEGLVAAGRDRNIFLFNPAAVTVTGYSREEAIGKPIDSIIKPMSEDANVLDTKILNEAFAGRGSKLPDKFTVLRKDASRLPVAGTAEPFSDERGDLLGIVVAIRDVSHEREIDKQKSGFISIASHQLRTPLSGVRWFLDLLLGGDAGPLKAQQKEFLTDIYTSTVRMINLVNDLLNVSRLEQGRVLLKPVPLDIAQVLEDIEKDHVALLKKKKLKFTRTVEKGLPTIMADKTAIQQALANVVANAINYTPDGGKIAVRARRDGDKIVIEVSDTGIGIPKTQQHRIFERFFRGTNAMSRETIGSGLGMHITKMMVESAGGSIRFESEEGKGTTFFVTLPVPAPLGTLST